MPKNRLFVDDEYRLIARPIERQCSETVATFSSSSAKSVFSQNEMLFVFGRCHLIPTVSLLFYLYFFVFFLECVAFYSVKMWFSLIPRRKGIRRNSTLFCFVSCRGPASICSMRLTFSGVQTPRRAFVSSLFCRPIIFTCRAQWAFCCIGAWLPYFGEGLYCFVWRKRKVFATTGAGCLSLFINYMVIKINFHHCV